MSIRRARTVDELYEAVADYDLVLTTDAPLSLALNRRIDRPRLGTFAATPRMLASGEFRPRDDRALFLELVDATDLDWKHAAHLVENVLGCWEETGDLHAILEYDQFDTPATREALAVIAATDSAHRDLGEYSVDEDTDVGVVGEDQFTALDRSTLPGNYDVIDPFGDGTFDLPAFHRFDSTTDIVDAVVDNVTPASAEDVAVVMDRGSEYPALVESALEADNVPFYGGPGFADDDHLRTFLRLLRTAFTADDTRLVEVRPILVRMGVDVPVEDDQKRLATIDRPAVEPVQRFSRSVDAMSFGEAVRSFEELCDTALDAFRAELGRLGMLEERVTREGLNDLAFYLQSFDVPVDREDSGVLLADATAAAYVDRPVVFSLGMDAGWTHGIPDRPWIDADERDRQHLRTFQLLLQNGREQYYLVQETAAGEQVTPCLYFHDLLDDEFDGFGDLPTIPHSQFAGTGATGFEHEPVDAEPAAVETLSQSSLSTFANCPRDYFFDRLVESPDRDYFRKGNLYHDFAEFYVNHPDVIDDADGEALVRMMLEEIRPFVADVQLEVLATEFAVGIETITSFISEHPPESRDYEGYEKREDSNVFAEHLEEPIESTVTEQWFENPALGGKGTVDLIHEPTRLLDYKSGGGTSASRIVDQSSLDPVHDDPDFQALLYLAHHRRVRPDERLEFVFFHFLDLLDDAVTGDPELEDALVRVTYHPRSFAAYAGDEAAFDALRDGVSESNDRRKTLERMGKAAYEEIFDAYTFPDTDDRDELLASEFATRFTDRAKAEVGGYTYVENGVASALKQLNRIRGRNYFREDVDAFEAFLDEQLDRVDEYRRSRFPVADPNVDRLTHRDLVRTDD